MLQFGMPKGCAERIHLSEVVSKAVGNVYPAKARRDRTIRENGDVPAHEVAHSDARTSERRAVTALGQHKKDHGCI
jgi:hypothetical protein